jgi:hypothetical protein
MAPGRISQSPTYLDVVCTTVALVPYQWPRPLSKYSKGRVLFRNSVLLLRVAVFLLPVRHAGWLRGQMSTWTYRDAHKPRGHTEMLTNHEDRCFCRHFPVVYFLVFTVHSTHKPKVMKEHNVVSQTCLVSRCRTDVFDDCAVPRLFVDIVKLPLKAPPLCVTKKY